MLVRDGKRHAGAWEWWLSIKTPHGFVGSFDRLGLARARLRRPGRFREDGGGAAHGARGVVPDAGAFLDRGMYTVILSTLGGGAR